MNTANVNKALRYTTAFVALVAAVLVACGVLVSNAYAADSGPAVTTQVSDDITRVHVNKLDADTHEYVQGASMAIIEKETGKVVDEWVTGKSTHQNEKNLDVGKTYILREVSAPDGFEKVTDTEFKINANEGDGITILSGPGELTESYKINLYDKAKAVENERVVERTRAGTENTSNEKNVAPKTGDETPIPFVFTLVAIGVLVIGVLEFAKRRVKE